MKTVNRIILTQVFAAMTLLIGRYLIAFKSPSGYATLTSFPASGSQALLFLGWNLFLASVPYALSLLLPLIRHRLAGVLVLIAWLLFLPNAPYLITDLIHLKPRPPVPFWADGMVFFFFAWTGLLLGLVSLPHIQRYLEQWYTTRQSHWWIGGFMLMSSFGLFLGRVGRWNSGEAVTHPSALLQYSFSLLASPTTTLMVFIGFFSLLQGLGYALLYHLISFNSDSSFKTSSL